MHPVIKILLFIFTLLFINFMHNSLVWLLCLFVCLLAVKFQRHVFFRIVKRMRWLFFSIVIIFAFATPGEYIQFMPNYFAPTIEGVFKGLLQIAKLLIALALLNILFATSSNAQLMTGLYTLLSPLSLVGFNAKQFTVRLMLTLDYFEEIVVKENLKINFKQLANMQINLKNLQEDKQIKFVEAPFNLIDKVIIAIFIFSILIYLYFTIHRYLKGFP